VPQPAGGLAGALQQGAALGSAAYGGSAWWRGLGRPGLRAWARGSTKPAGNVLIEPSPPLPSPAPRPALRPRSQLHEHSHSVPSTIRSYITEVQTQVNRAAPQAHSCALQWRGPASEPSPWSHGGGGGGSRGSRPW
jgi:hypothetical protein